MTFDIPSVGSDGELEPEVDDDKIVTEEDRARAADIKAQANEAFAGELAILSILLAVQDSSSAVRGMC